MTGLDIEKDQIIEMACIITDSDLNVLAEVRPTQLSPGLCQTCELKQPPLSVQGPNLIINQPDSLLEGMSEWCKEHHGKVSHLCCLQV